MAQIVVERAINKGLDAVVPLIMAQEARQYALDRRLEQPHSRSEVRNWVAEEFDEEGEPLIAHDASGAVRGFTIARYFDLEASNPMRSFYTQRNGAYRMLVFPDSGERDAAEVTAALLNALTTQWRIWGTYADLLTWPSADTWFAPIFRAEGFAEDSIIAYRANVPFPTPGRQPDASLKVRLARNEDEDKLVGLHIAEIQFHADTISHVQMVSGIEPDFREKLGRLWSGQSAERGAPIVVVVEQDGEVVAMAENYIERTPGWGALSRFPPGRYGYLNSVGVRADKRGQGIGHLLAQGVYEAFAPYKVDAFGLWYMPRNPLSSVFWPRMGFRPLWTQYQRRSAE